LEDKKSAVEMIKSSAVKGTAFKIKLITIFLGA
jgi:hypothetical protein